MLGASVWKHCLSLDPLFIQCPQVSNLDHALSFRLNVPLPPYFSSSLLFSTSTRINAPNDRGLSRACWYPGTRKCSAVERGAPPPSLPPLLSQVRIEGQEGLMCCCCTVVRAITMAACRKPRCISFLLKERFVCDLFFWPLGSTSFSNCWLKRFTFRCCSLVSWGWKDDVLWKLCPSPAAQESALNHPKDPQVPF